MILPVTLCAAAAAAIINIWLSVRVGQMRGKTKVSIGDDAGGPLTARMRAQLNFVENTAFVLILIAAIELAGSVEVDSRPAATISPISASRPGSMIGEFPSLIASSFLGSTSTAMTS